MAYIFGLAIVALLFLALHYFTNFNKFQKTSIATTLLVAILLAITYNSYNTNKQKKMLNAVLKFKQNKTINCNNIDINSSNYTLSIGTYTFIGKKNSSHSGEMVSATLCQ